MSRIVITEAAELSYRRVGLAGAEVGHLAINWL